MAKLIVYSGDKVVREIPLVKEPFFIGRALESDLAVMDHLVSRKHAKIEKDGGGGLWKVTDLGSSNGVFVNDQKVKERVLGDGDKVRIGSATIEFKDELANRRTARGTGMHIAFSGESERRSDLLRQVRNIDSFRFGEHHGPFQRVFELPYVSRPLIVFYGGESFFRQPRDVSLQLLIQGLDEMVG